MPLHVSSTSAHRQEAKIVLYSLWYHHTCRWPSGAQVHLCTGRPPDVTKQTSPVMAFGCSEMPSIGLILANEWAESRSNSVRKVCLRFQNPSRSRQSQNSLSLAVPNQWLRTAGGAGRGALLKMAQPPSVKDGVVGPSYHEYNEFFSQVNRYDI